MPGSSGRRRKTCYHEAAHAFVRWYFGFPTDRATVLTVEEVRAGKRLRTGRGYLVACEGLVIGSDILEPPYGPRVCHHDQAGEDRWRNYRRDVELIDCCAGFHAEAYYAHACVTSSALAGGDGDVRQFRAVIDGWFPDAAASDGPSQYRALEARVLAWTRALIRSSKGHAAIRDVAEALHARGRLSGKQIAMICRKAFGGRECGFEGWAERWPPTLPELREGLIPGKRVRTVIGTVPAGQGVQRRETGNLGGEDVRHALIRARVGIDAIAHPGLRKGHRHGASSPMDR